MASNFHIITYKDGDSLYLSLSGDFDGGSAHELINTLTKNGNGSWDIFIDTNNLKTIHPFGRDEFQKNFSSIIKQLENLIIVGTNKYKFEQIWSNSVN
jgi:anti-anti-sigma regulatory factor